MKGDKTKVEESISKKKKTCTIYEELKGWKDVETGGIIKTKNSECQNTGSWRNFRPVRDKKKCINCMLCWSVCPDDAIKGKDGNFGHFDYNHCKGCGLCAKVCPVNCIEMRPESEFRNNKEKDGKESKNK